MYTWGTNTHDECGCGSKANNITPPMAISTPVPFVSLDAGGDEPTSGHVLALDAAGNVYCWGDNTTGQCGISTFKDVATPTLVPGAPQVSTALAGGQYSILLTASGNMYTFGYDADGELGDGRSTNTSAPELILSGVSQISAGAQHGVAATS